MKKLVLLVAIVTTLMSCSDRRKLIKFPNGSIVKAFNQSGIDYQERSKVCVRRSTGDPTWTICNDGEMGDTTYIVSFKVEGKDKGFVVTHKVGQIIRD
jgi:hypothetical protein